MERSLGPGKNDVNISSALSSRLHFRFSSQTTVICIASYNVHAVRVLIEDGGALCHVDDRGFQCMY